MLRFFPTAARKVARTGECIKGVAFSTSTTKTDQRQEYTGPSEAQTTTTNVKPPGKPKVQVKYEPEPKWTPKSKRVGVLAIKKGMMSVWDSWGARHAVTVLHLDGCQALQAHYNPAQKLYTQDIGAGEQKMRRCDPLQKHYFNRCQVPAKRKIIGFTVTAGGIIQPSTPIYAAHFVPGQLVDVQGTSIGKGTQGVMKRWGFSGGPASHGVTKNHRKGGSIGARTDPGRVFKGTKMAGRMGNEKVTVQRLKVMQVDNALNCIYVKGAVPGCDSKYVRVKDSHHNPIFLKTPPPFPTYIPDPANPLPRIMVAPAEKKDPFNTVPADSK